jgi:transcriptional regulator with XRE-family HTH domain
MKISDLLTEEALLAELGERLAQTRLNRNVTQAELAREAGVSKRTVERLEAGASTQLSNLVRIVRALGLLENFELLVPEPTPSPIQQLKRQSRKRIRASTASRTATAAPWKWGEE